MSDNKVSLRGGNLFSQFILILILLFSVSSINVLFMAMGILPFLPNTHLNPHIPAAIAIIAFVLTASVSGYHVRTMVRRKKRRNDQRE